MKKRTKAILLSLLGVFVLGGTLTGVLYPREAEKTSGAATVKQYSYDSDVPFFNDFYDNIEIDNDASLDRYFDTLAPTTNASNFQSLGTSRYEGINGKVVTADVFDRKQGESLNDPNYGQTMLIYQAIQYKVKHPEVEMYMDFSTYRFSITASACLRRDSKFFGYMRSLFDREYDEFGFVRMAFMFIEAARMGIHVMLVPHLESYAVNQLSDTDPKGYAKKTEILHWDYFKNFENINCYSQYAEGKKVSDFLSYNRIMWNVNERGNDMNHIKALAVNHYLDQYGVEHDGSIFYESANVDALDYLGRNGNTGAQSGVLISDHEDLYNCTHNFLNLMAKYTKTDEISEFRYLSRTLNEYQLDLIDAGLQDSIPYEERITYKGSETDKVFELYFSPFAGNISTWDKQYNPFCKYISEMKKSKREIVFTWTMPYVGYGTQFDYTMEDMICEAFHQNKNPLNRIYLHMPDFVEEKYNDLVVGVDIGFKDVNSHPKRYLHSKDIAMSYYEGDVHKYVTIMSSCNYGSAPYWQRTNQTLVIKESEQSHPTYTTLGAATTYGCITKDEEPGLNFSEKSERYSLTKTFDSFPKTFEATIESKANVITNDKGRLSKDDIEKLVKEAEKFKDEDKKVKERIEAKNGLEQYCYQVKQTVSDAKLKDKFSEDEKKQIESKVDEVLKFSNDNPAASKEEYDAKVKEVEAIFNPIMQKIYQQAGYNPASGCVPLILQFLIIFAMYNLFNNYFEFRGASFIPNWIPDLTAGDSVYTFTGKGIPLLGSQIRILPVVYVASQILFSVLTQNAGATAGQQNSMNMKFMTYGMPILFFFLFYNAPSGLLIYWITSNLFQMIQQLIINAMMKKKRAEMKAKRKEMDTEAKKLRELFR